MHATGMDPIDWHSEIPASLDPNVAPIPPDFVDDEDYLDGYYGDEYGDYGDYPHYLDDDDYGYYSRITLAELLDQCVIPTVSQAVQTVYPLLGLCIISRVTSIFSAEVFHGGGLGKFLSHSCSAVCGIIALNMFFEENLVYLVMLAILAYVLLAVTNCKCRGLSGVTVSFVTVVYLLTCELMVVKESEWHRIRGAQMVLAMKLISLAFDLDSGALPEMPTFWEYAGYVFQIGSVIFGPWVSFTDYAHLAVQRERKLDFYWVAKLLKSFTASLMCIVISTCIVHWLVLDGSFIWLLAYRDAQSFRFSHYFVSSLSELTVTLTGLGYTKTNGDVRWDLSVARPFHIEFPRSLVEVVTNWNLPMHYWLKTYVFKNARPLGNFAAILLTYAASSVLHGLNFQLAAVLLSLGFYSYVEHVLRSRLSKAFDACILAKQCKKECQHAYKSTHPYVILANLGLGLLTVFHLAYLGLMFDSSSDQDEGYTMEHTLGKWSELGYASHWVAMATYVYYLLI